MKGSNEFVYTLVIGLVILGILVAAFSGDMSQCKGDQCNRKNPGIIEAVKTFSIPRLAASNMLQNQHVDVEGRWVQSGLLFGEEKITYDLIKPGLQDVTLNFRITSTNDLGDLIIKLNGEVIESRHFEAGQYSIRISPELLKDENHFEISAESSWWKIWAPNIYKITDVSIDYTSYFSDFSQFKFYLGEEFLNMEFAKIDLLLPQNVGSLIVELNGKPVWNSPVGNLQSIVFDKTSLRLGDNIVTLKAGKNSMFLGNGTIVVIFLAQYPESFANQTGAITAVQTFTGYSNQFYNV